MAEEGRVKLRNARRDANEELKDLKKNNKMTEDELFGAQEEVQKLLDQHIEKTDKILTAKEKEIMEI
jgi:Ribosome recycling factor